MNVTSHQTERALFEEPSITSLPLGHYRIRVGRGSLPSIAELEEVFSLGGVSTLFHVSCRWKSHQVRRSVNDAADEAVIYIHDFGHEVTYNAVIAWGVANRYLPANEKEMLALALDPQTHDLATQGPLLGLGSYVMHKGIRHISVLYTTHQKRFFQVWKNYGWPRASRFVFIRAVS